MDNSLPENIPIANTSPPSALDIGISVSTKKIRNIQLDGAKAFGSRFDIVDGKGQIIAKVFPPDYEEHPVQNYQVSLPENFAENFMEMYGTIELMSRKIEERLS